MTPFPSQALYAFFPSNFDSSGRGDPLIPSVPHPLTAPSFSHIPRSLPNPPPLKPFPSSCPFPSPCHNQKVLGSAVIFPAGSGDHQQQVNWMHLKYTTTITFCTVYVGNTSHLSFKNPKRFKIVTSLRFLIRFCELLHWATPPSAMHCQTPPPLRDVLHSLNQIHHISKT